MTNLQGGQAGDVTARDSAGGNIYNITNDIAEGLKMLIDDINRIDVRLTTLEQLENQHIEERRSIMRVVSIMSIEAQHAKDLKELFEKRIAEDAGERITRQRYVDRLLLALLAISAANVASWIAQAAWRRVARRVV